MNLARIYFFSLTKIVGASPLKTTKLIPFCLLSRSIPNMELMLGRNRLRWTDANSGSDRSDVKCSLEMFISFWIELAGWSKWAGWVTSFSKPSLIASLFCRKFQPFLPSYYWFQIFLEHFSRLAHIHKISYLMFFFCGGDGFEERLLNSQILQDSLGSSCDDLL